MRGDQLARQWRIIRAIEASPNGLTVAEIAQREETGIRTIYRDLEALQAAGFSLYAERAGKGSCWPFVDTFKSRTSPLLSCIPVKFAKKKGLEFAYPKNILNSISRSFFIGRKGPLCPWRERTG